MDTININMENLSAEEREQLLNLIKKSNKPKNKIWKPKTGECYYYIGCGIAKKAHYNNFDEHNNDLAIGNCFKTREEAEFMIEKLKVIAELKRFAEENNEHGLDWNDNAQYKYCLVYDFLNNKFDTHLWTYEKYNAIYFSSYEIAMKAVDIIGAERLKKYYFGVVD